MRNLLWFSLVLAACSSPAKPTVVSVTTPDTTKVDPVSQMVEDLAALRIDKLGNPVLRWDHIPPVLAAKERPHKLLVLLVEYQDQGFDRFKGDADQGAKLAAFYQEQLFDDDYKRVDTISHYYQTQSLGAYHVSGKVLAPVKLQRTKRDYGSQHRPAGGSWRNDAEPEGLVADALAAAHKAYPEMNWSDFDRWDPDDINGNKNLDEGDGYLDHFVVVFAGKGQSSCEGLHKIRDILTTNVGMEALDKLSPEQRECADRIWPHRSKVKLNDGRGPVVAGKSNPKGGLPLSDSLWIRDYNMQSEYTGASTFIHEFGHSIGLPDVYSRTSSNSTGAWEVMSHTTSPSPQNLSAWSRLMLGWLKPTVIKPPTFGGNASETLTLHTLDDPAGDYGDATRAAMIVLPPKEKHIELGAFPETLGTWALYSGQGNDLNRKASLALDLSKASGAIELSFDAWWEIEGGWDFAYLEASSDDGKSWTRLLPTERGHMPAKHGHDGKQSLPGFTGLSGDLDGDGKNESNATCDPAAELPHGEDKDASNLSPCLKPSWVRPAFDLSSMAGKQVSVRLRYYTDGAAVLRGMVIDNVVVNGLKVDGDFEDSAHEGWSLAGFSLSNGSHDLLVPHFYILEYRDPYAKAVAGQHRYDAALAKANMSFYANPKTDDMMALQVRSRPGVLVWYYNGAFAWSENDPSLNGPGKGYLLAVDSNTSEIALPGLEDWFKGSQESNDTHYEVTVAEAQGALQAAYERTVCFVRSKSYLPKTGLRTKNLKKLGCKKGPAPVAKIEVEGRPLRYSYEVANELLPGAARKAVARASELLDTKSKKGEIIFRLRDRSLRALHTKDAPLSADEFKDAINIYKVGKNGLEKVESRDYPAAPAFSDSQPERFMNMKLPFGGVGVPQSGLSISVAPRRNDDAGNARVDVEISWQ